MYRELHEEVGLLPEHVRILGRTRDWMRYEVPQSWSKRESRGGYRGQKQIWYLLRLIGRDCDVCLRASSHPEFDAWRWNDYWLDINAVIEFKREVYTRALNELFVIFPLLPSTVRIIVLVRSDILPQDVFEYCGTSGTLFCRGQYCRDRVYAGLSMTISLVRRKWVT